MIHTWSHRHFADPTHGEWYGYRHRDGSVSTALKSSLWKSFFHHPRMQWYCWRLLEPAASPGFRSELRAAQGPPAVREAGRREDLISRRRTYDGPRDARRGPIESQV